MTGDTNEVFETIEDLIASSDVQDDEVNLDEEDTGEEDTGNEDTDNEDTDSGDDDSGNADDAVTDGYEDGDDDSGGDSGDGEEDGDKSKSDSPQTFEVTLDGKTVEVTQEELVRGYGHAQAAANRFQEADRLHKQATEFIKTLQANPLGVLADERLGINMDELVEAYTKQKTAYEGMSPAERELAATKRQLAQMEADRKSKDDIQQKQFLEQQSARITQEIDSAIELASLPNNDFVFNRYIEYMTRANEKNIQVTPAALSELVKEDYNDAMKEMLGKAKSEELLGLLGDKVKDIRKADIKNLKSGKKAPAKRQAQVVEPTTRKEKVEPRTLEDWKEEMGIIG